MGLISEEQAKQFELMLARCRHVSDFEQVMEAVRHFCGGIQHDTDRYARLVQDDFLDLDESTTPP